MPDDPRNGGQGNVFLGVVLLGLVIVVVVLGLLVFGGHDMGHGHWDFWRH